VWPRFVQGLGLGFTFVPLTTLALATVAKDASANATAASTWCATSAAPIGIALATTYLVRRSQHHQAAPGGPRGRVERGDDADGWGSGRSTSGTAAPDTYTASRRATAMLYHDTVTQAQVLAYGRRVLGPLDVFFASSSVLPSCAACARNPARAASGWRACRRRSSRPHRHGRPLSARGAEPA